MTDKPWLDYSGQTTDELLALTKTHREDSIVVAFETALSAKDPDSLTEEERVVLAVEAMEREVNNGGFDQFFINSSNQFAPILLDSLKKIGCPKTAAIVDRALQVLGLRPPFDPEDVDSSMAEDSTVRDRALKACDDEYFDGDEPIADRLLAFIRANAAKISLT